MTMRPFHTSEVTTEATAKVRLKNVMNKIFLKNYFLFFVFPSIFV